MIVIVGNDLCAHVHERFLYFLREIINYKRTPSINFVLFCNATIFIIAFDLNIIIQLLNVRFTTAQALGLTCVWGSLSALFFIACKILVRKISCDVPVEYTVDDLANRQVSSIIAMQIHCIIIIQ